MWFRFAICFLFGIFGVHKFVEKKVGMGLLYLFTLGLFGLGWLHDCVKYLAAAIDGTDDAAEEQPENADEGAKGAIKKVLLWVLTALFMFVGIVSMALGGIASCVIALVIAMLIIPVDEWQNIVHRYIGGKAKLIIAIALAVICVVALPTTSGNSTELDGTAAVTVTAEPKKETTITVTPKPSVKPTVEPTAEPTVEPTAEPTAEPTTALTPTTTPTPEPTETTEPSAGTSTGSDSGSTGGAAQEATGDYVVNTGTGKFHYLSCSSVGRISAENRMDYSGSRDELISRGYVPCKRCNP